MKDKGQEVGGNDWGAQQTSSIEGRAVLQACVDLFF